MASFKKVLLLYFSLLFFFTCVFITTSSTEAAIQQVNSNSNEHFGGRKMLEMDNDDEEENKPIKKKSTSTTTTTTTLTLKKNQTKLLKPITNTSSKNQTKLVKTINGGNKNQTKQLVKTAIDSSSSLSTKNKTKLIKPISDLKSKLNSTSKPSDSILIKKSSDLTKATSPKNKTTKPITTKADTKTQLQQKSGDSSKSKNNEGGSQKPKSQKIQQKTKHSWIDQDEDDDDLVAEFRDLPSKFQETFLPDMDKISRTSQVYLTRYNKEITKNVKPIVGNKYANTIASIVSFAFIIIPLILVSLIFNRITAYFSLQKLLIFIQVYLSIYFTILCLSSVVTGLEPLKFFYATSQSTYVCLQVLQTLAYVLYLLLLLMYLVLVFSTESGMFSKLLGLGQTFVGFSVGLHYYMTVFHRAVLHQPPKTSWKVHAIYATCFFVICLLSRADRRKKAYLGEGSEEGKKS